MQTGWQTMQPGNEFALVVDTDTALVYGAVLQRLLSGEGIGKPERLILQDLKQLLLHMKEANHG